MMKLLRLLFAGLLLMLGSNLIMAQGEWNPDNPPEPSAKYKITVSSSPNYAYTSGTGWYTKGQQVWIYSSAYSENYKFKYWTKNGEQYSEQTSFNYTVESENVNFVAVYEYDPVNPAEPDGIVAYHLYLNSDVTGSCSFSRTSGAKVKEGENISVNVYVNQGYKFLGWYNGEDKVGESTYYSFTMPANDVTLTAHMEYSPESPADPESPPDQPVTTKIKAKSYERLYGETNPTFDYVTNVDISGTPVLTCEADEKSPVGTYTIKVDRGSVEGEDVVTVDGTLTVKKAKLTVQGKEYTIKQGDDIPDFELDYIGFKNEDTKDCLTTQPTVSCTATDNSPVGEYEIKVTGGEATNYSITCTNGKLTITQADPAEENRMLVNLSIGTADNAVDKTRIVFNENASLSYETERDAAKILSNEADFQIYSLDASGVKYSINERPADNGTVPLGIVVKNTGNVTVKATRKDCPIVLVDKTQNAEFDFANGDYTFNCDAGTYEGRFYIKKVAADAVTITAKSYTRTYGEDNPTFEYTSTGAELNGAPTISCDATATSDVGTYPITISTGSVTNSSVTLVNGTLTITKTPLTIKAGEYTKTQGEDNPAFTLTYEGFKNNETSEVLTTQPTVSCEATKESAVGEYTVTVSGAEATNYDISYTNGKLTITEAPVTITATDCSRVYGEANPTFEYTSTGATLNGIPTLSCDATATSNVGTYTITVAKGSVTNGNVSLVNGTLTVTKASLAVSVGEYTITEGDDIPNFNIAYEGFKNNETAEVLTTAPTATCTATKESKAGEYEITISGGEATNYDFSYTAGKLIIQEPLVTITAKDCSRAYGEANPTFEYTTSGAELSGTPTLSCDATATSNVGTYAITVAKGNVTNGNVSLVNGTLTVTKASLAVSVGEYTITEGDNIPTFTITYDGFKNNETVEVLTTAPTVTCNATKDSKAGEYEISISGGAATNYEFSYTAGKLIIKQKEFEGTVEGGDNSNEGVEVTFVITNDDNDGSSGGETPTVSVSKGSDVSGECIIPDKVTHGDKTYEVTEIAAGAFENNEKLESVTIPESVETIGDNAFSGCMGLQSIKMLRETPIDFSSPATARGMRTRASASSIFDGVDLETCILYVPEVSVDKYKAAEVWKEFKNILPIASSGIRTVLNADGRPFSVYNLNGRKVKANATSLDGLPKGVYIVNGKKIVVK